MSNSLKVILVIIGTLIGAGFASGKEVFIFFNKYGIYGLYGICLAGILISVVILKVFKIIKNNNINNYKDLINNISKYKKINIILNNIINAFLLISFFVMVSGFTAYFNEQFGINTFIISVVMSTLCLITFNKNIGGITKVNTILIPFLIIFIIITAILNCKYFLHNISYIKQFVYNIECDNWVLSSILYASYNIIVLIPILIGVKDFVHKNNITKISIISGTIFVILGISLFSILTRGQGYIQYLDIPIIFIMEKFGGVYSSIYGIIVAIAIFTSAISAGYGFLKNFESSKVQYKMISIIICGISIFVSMIKFS